MAKGRKTGGRQKGTPNKLSLTVATRLEELGCDPIEGMARIAMDSKSPDDLRGRMCAELANYVYPKRKAIEHSGKGGTELFPDLTRMRTEITKAMMGVSEEAMAELAAKLLEADGNGNTG